MLKKQLLLTALSVILVTGFFCLPRNKQWAKKIMDYAKDIPYQSKHLDRETRLADRFGNEYTYTQSIAESMQRNNQQNLLLLMPPTSYFTKSGMKYHVPEPAVFYYFTGIKTVWADSREAINADIYVYVRDGNIRIASGKDKTALKDTISSFRKCGVSL